jgi:hypothetical protein
MCLFTTTYAEQKIVGFVFDKKNKNLLYQEFHTIDAKQHKVSYQVRNDKPFAEKNMILASLPYQPNVEFESQHCGEAFSVRKKENKLSISYRNQCDKSIKTKSIKLKKPFVIDAGFNPFISGNMIINKRKKSEFYYPVPSRLEWVKMKSKFLPCKKIKKIIGKFQMYQKIQMDRCIKIQPANWLIAQIFPPIYLGYNGADLSIFIGRSNMANAKGDYRDIVIFYFKNNQDVKAV